MGDMILPGQQLAISMSIMRMVWKIKTLNGA